VLLLVPLAVLMLWIGLAPKPFLTRSEPTARFLLETVEQKRLSGLQEAERTVESKAVALSPMFTEQNAAQ
jgi:NADH-quinone oxidoreductase subunit M